MLIFKKVLFCFKLLSIDWIDTIRINLKLPINQAIYLPIIVYKCHIDSIKGDIRIESDSISTGMIRLGLRTSTLYFSNYGICISIQEGGLLCFKGPGYMGNNSAIEIGKNAKVTFGQNFGITSNFKISSRKAIQIGENFSSSWEVNVFDTDFHNLYNLQNQYILESDKEVFIGDDVWICQRVTVLKGSFIPSRSIIASNSMVNKSFEGMPKNSIYAGLPAKFIKTDFTRKEFIDFEKQPMVNIVKYLNL